MPSQHFPFNTPLQHHTNQAVCILIKLQSGPKKQNCTNITELTHLATLAKLFKYDTALLKYFSYSKVVAATLAFLLLTSEQG